MAEKPIIGILLGDSAGVGPEIAAKVSGSGFLEERCRPIIIGDVRVFEKAIEVAGEKVKHYVINDVSEADWSKGIPVLDQKNQNPDDIKVGEINLSSGKAINEMLELSSQLCKDKKIDGFAFCPLNKSAMIDAGCTFESEHHLMANIFGVSDKPFGEINVLGNLMTTRTTSHIPIADVSRNLSVQRILNAIILCNETVTKSGVAKPIIGVAALNPHAGENGRCGREELDIITPAIEKAKEQGIDARGPFPSDILFIKAFNGELDSAVTMYHDQGQIALKLKGFDQGVTVAGGQPYPIATCAHGTAYDIAGQNKASTSAFENAVSIVVNMANNA